MDYVRPNVAIPAVSTLLPATAAAHGGISAIGALLPFFIALWSLGLLLTIWFIYSLVMLAMAVESITPRKQKIYKVLSYTIVWTLVGIGLLVAPFSAIVLSLLAWSVAGVVAAATNFILRRNENRAHMADGGAEQP